MNGLQASDAPLLEFDHVTKWYGRIAALMDVSFRVGTEVVGLVGKNGVGKSTLMKLAVGLLRPSQGSVRIALPYNPSIRPGGFAEARISSGQTTAPVLPQSAVLSDNKGNYVYVVNAKNEIVRQSVKVGSVGEQGLTISEGLTGNERIVESAGAFLNPGQKVQPRRVAAAQ